MQRKIGFVAVLALLLLPMLIGVSHSLVLRPEPRIFKPETPSAKLPAKPVDAATLIESARDSIVNDRPTLQSDIDNLFLALLRSRDAVDHYNLMAAIGEIGDIKGTSPVKVKNYVRQLVLLVFQSLPKDDRIAAATVWIGLFPTQRMMEREIGIVAPANRVDEKEGLAFLRARGVGVSYRTLTEALRAADVELTQAVLQAGLKVDNDNIESTYEVVRSSLQDACRDPTIPADWINGVITRLVEFGYPIDHVDRSRRTLLFDLVTDCTGSVVAHVADLGVSVDWRDDMGITPLERALTDDRFDAADVLMERGARLSPTAAKRALMFPRQDSRRADYVMRATETK